MKHTKILTRSISILIVAVLAIVAFARGPVKDWLLIGVFSLWLLTLLISVLVSRKAAIKKWFARKPKQAGKLQPEEEPQPVAAQISDSIDLDDGVKKNYAIFADVLAKI